MPRIEFSEPASQELWADLMGRLPELESSLPAIGIAVGVLVGELSPMPSRAGVDTAERIPGAWPHIETGAGHFPWYESPGCLLAAMNQAVTVSQAT